jgi:phage-related protein
MSIANIVCTFENVFMSIANLVCTFENVFMNIANIVCTFENVFMNIANIVLAVCSPDTAKISQHIKPIYQCPGMFTIWSQYRELNLVF